MVEVKREAIAAEHDNREWEAWKAAKRQAEREGQLATPEQKRELVEHIRKIAFGPQLVPMKGAKHGTSGKAVSVQQSAESVAQVVAPTTRTDGQENKSECTGSANV